MASCSVRTHERGISINANKCSTYYNVGERSVGGKVIMPDGYQLGRTRDAEQVYMQRNDIIGSPASPRGVYDGGREGVTI